MGVCYLWLVICWITAPVLGFVIAWVCLQSRLNKAKQHADSVEESLDASRKEVEGLTGAVNGRQAKMTELEQIVAQNGRLISDLTTQTEVQTESIAMLEGSISGKDAQIRELDARVKKADSELQTLQGSFLEKGREIDSLKEELDRLRATASQDCGPDDLTRIEGIGPKTSQILRDHGIVTFRELAGSPVDGLKEILAKAAHGKLAHPDTWPEQAALAADLKWAELKVLQDRLKGGRRVL